MFRDQGLGFRVENLQFKSFGLAVFRLRSYRDHGRWRWLCKVLLGGSWVVISRVISPLIWVISIVTLLITLLITTHEPPSTP